LFPQSNIPHFKAIQKLATVFGYSNYLCELVAIAKVPKQMPHNKVQSENSSQNLKMVLSLMS
jgi:hypothetical protein